jgi:hypothetical protein
VVIASYSGCLTTGTPLDVFSQNSATASNTAIATSVATTASNDKLIYVDFSWDGTGLSPPSGMTERSTASSTCPTTRGDRRDRRQDTIAAGHAQSLAGLPCGAETGAHVDCACSTPFNPAVFLPFLVR